MTRRRTWLIHTLFLLALVLLYFWRLVTPLAKDRAIFIESDFNLQFYPWLTFVYDQWRHLRLPLWNPYINAGQPGLADIQLAALYPVNLIVFLLLALARQPFIPPALVGIILLHVWLAAVFTYALVRHLTRAAFPALLAAIVYAFSGYMVTYATIQLSVIQTAAWLPLLLLAVERLVRHEHRRHVLALALVLAVSLLAGHPQLFVYNAYAALLYFVVRAAETHPPRRVLLRVGTHLAPAFLLAVGLTAAQLLPTAELFAHSYRAEQLNFHYVSAGLLPDQWLAYVVPAALGDPLFFLGTTAAVLAALGLVGHWNVARVWAALGLAFFLLVMGGHTFAYVFAYVALPGFGLFRDQYRAAYIVVLSVAVLAGWGARRFLSPDQNATTKAVRHALRWLTLAVLGVGLVLHLAHAVWPDQPRLAALSTAWAWPEGTLLAMLALFILQEKGRLPATWVRGLLLGLLMLELFSPIWTRPLRDRPPEGLFPTTSIVQAMQRDPARPFRISSEGLLPGGPNSAIIFGLEDVLGYTPLRLEVLARLDALPELRRWGLLNVRYVLTTRDFSGDGRFALVAQEGEKRLYRFGGADALPRVFVVHQARIVQGDAVWQAVQDVNPRTTAVLETAPAIALPGPVQAEDRVRILTYQPQRMVIEVDMAAAGLVVFSEMDYPGWRAYVDDRRAPVYRAYGALRAVPVPAGSHRVEMVYRPLVFYAGAVISLGTFILILWLWRKQE